MEPRISPSSQPNLADSKGLKIIQWEDLEQELARLWSLSSALKEAEDKKSSLKEKLESLIQVQAKSLSRSNKLEEMQDKLEARKLVMGDMLMDSKCESVNAKKKEEQLNGDVRLLLVAGANLSAANKKLQEDNASLSGKRGYEHLKSLQKTIGKRQQYMISQVSFLYPVKAFVERGHELELESFLNGVRSGNPSGSKRLNEGALSISGLQLTMLSFTKMSFFTDKKVVQRSATALGYAAHAVFLIASYLKVPLRYPLCLGGSRSYVADPAPPVEPNSYDLPSSSVNATYMKTIEFPLFLEGQDRTRAAYGVFLLNKDLEQLLNFVGVNSLGPRHVLANLKELLRTILSAEYKDR